MPVASCRVSTDRRTRELELGDGPLLPRFAPQRKGDRPPAQRLALALSGQDILELEVRRSACPSVTRSWIASWRLRMRPWTTTSATLSSACSDSATAQAEPRFPAASILPAVSDLRPGSTLPPGRPDPELFRSRVGSNSSPAPPVVAHPVEISAIETSRMRTTNSSRIGEEAFYVACARRVVTAFAMRESQ